MASARRGVKLSLHKFFRDQMLQLDHLVYAVPDLAQACLAFAAQTGITPTPGGVHPGRGTQNALVRLGPSSYLEFIGPHPDWDLASTRWMAVDQVRLPTLTRWAATPHNLTSFAKTLHAFDPAFGRLIAGQRQTPEGQSLRWEMTFPSMPPQIDVIPFGIDWSQSDHHPSEKIPTGASLKSFGLSHPEARRIQRLFDALQLDIVVEHSEQPKISATLLTPHGTLHL